jgi:16S rRNA (guanine(966)-N(2))-methyltransferase RsmD
MRITGGKYRGRQVKCPKGVIRPAMDRMRESLFSILGDLSGLSFLDLFSGSGLVGLEAASRGATPVVLVEKDGGKKRVILENCAIAEDNPPRLFVMPVERFLRQFKTAYDIVYLDPPFPFGRKVEMVEEVSRRGLIKPGGLIIIHYPEEDKWPDQVDNLEVVDKRKYGRSILLFFKSPGEGELL